MRFDHSGATTPLTEGFVAASRRCGMGIAVKSNSSTVRWERCVPGTVLKCGGGSPNLDRNSSTRARTLYRDRPGDYDPNQNKRSKSVYEGKSVLTSTATAFGEVKKSTLTLHAEQIAFVKEQTEAFLAGLPWATRSEKSW